MWGSVQICWTDKSEDSRSCPGKKCGEGRDSGIGWVSVWFAACLGLMSRTPERLAWVWLSGGIFYWDGKHRRSFRFEGEEMRLVQKCRIWDLWFSQKEASRAESGTQDADSSSRYTFPTVFSRHLKLPCPKLASWVFSLMCFSTLSLPHSYKRHYPCNCTSWTLDYSRDL